MAAKKRSAKAVSRKAKKTGSHRPSKQASDIHTIENDPTKVFKRLWDEESGGFVAELIDMAEARQIGDEANPPTVTPIRGDPDHVIRCDFDMIARHYRCRRIRADDPLATL